MFNFLNTFAFLFLVIDFSSWFDGEYKDDNNAINNKNLINYKAFLHYSDQNWHHIDSNIREQIDYTKRGDGEFWMSYQDFCREFEEVTICSLTPDLSYSTKGTLVMVWNYCY